MGNYITLSHIHTGCSKKPRYLYPAGVVIELPEGHPRTNTWLNLKKIQKTDEELTDPKVIASKMVKLTTKKR